MFFFVFSDAAQATASSRALLLSIDVQSQPSSVIFCFDRFVPVQTFSLQNPDRFVLDMPNTTLASDRLKNIRPNHPLFKTIRIGQPNGKKLRAVIETDFIDQNLLAWRSIEPTVSSAKCFAINVSTRKQADKSKLSQKSTEYISKQQPFVTSVTGSTFIVALDPGHGGKDPGAIGPRGRMEKHITLAIAKQLQRQINAVPGMKAILTRDADKYIDLRQRLRLARRADADVFISIHADAFINPESRGAAVFALSQAGATSEAARWLAEKENYSELGGVNLSGLDDESGLVRTVLLDLSQTATISASLKMGMHVLNHLKEVTRLHHAHVEQARFMVLKSPDIPSILIETGFISNPNEERRLESQAYQRLITSAIMSGVTQYIKQYPSSKLSPSRHHAVTLYTVAAGESLSQIAAKYHLSIAQLKKANPKMTRMIRPGQKINLPTS